MEIGGIKVLNVQLGDMVECVDTGFTEACFTKGEKYGVGMARGVIDNFGNQWKPDSVTFRIVSRANPATTSPVRTVSHREIVPGVYGWVYVSENGEVNTLTMTDSTQIRTTIATLTEIADALEENNQ